MVIRCGTALGGEGVEVEVDVRQGAAGVQGSGTRAVVGLDALNALESGHQ